MNKLGYARSKDAVYRHKYQPDARPRVAKSMKEYFKSAGVGVLPWPGSLPEMNPPDYGYRASLKGDIRRKRPRNFGRR